MLAGLVLGGCGAATQTTQNKMEENTVTKVGTISTKMGDEYLLTTDDGIVNLASNKINLDGYIKKKITVTGMFSGTTLYVDKVEQQ